MLKTLNKITKRSKSYSQVTAIFKDSHGEIEKAGYYRVDQYAKLLKSLQNHTTSQLIEIITKNTKKTLKSYSGYYFSYSIYYIYYINNCFYYIFIIFNISINKEGNRSNPEIYKFYGWKYDPIKSNPTQVTKVTFFQNVNKINKLRFQKVTSKMIF